MSHGNCSRAIVSIWLHLISRVSTTQLAQRMLERWGGVVLVRALSGRVRLADWTNMKLHTAGYTTFT